MQTLNVGAGRSDEDYKAAEVKRRADLRSESRADANYFFIAALLAALGTGVFLVRIPILLSIGSFELLIVYAGQTVRSNPLLLYAAAAAWVGILVGLGFLAQKGHRWAFWAGVVLYAADMIALMITFSWLSIGVHAFFVFKWFQGQRALQELTIAPASA